ncbi:MAG: hypothetical protein V1871_08635 [Planctomycetota bacterium]
MTNDIGFEHVKGWVCNMRSYLEDKINRNLMTPKSVEDCAILIEQLEDLLRIASAGGTEPKSVEVSTFNSEDSLLEMRIAE